jgi:hypothetical protein
LRFRIFDSAGARRYLARALLGLLTTVGVLGHVTGHAAAQRYYRAASVKSIVDEAVVQPSHRIQRLVLFTIGNDALHRLVPRHTQRCRELHAIARRHYRIGDDGDTVPPDGAAGTQRPTHMGQQPLPKMDRILPARVSDMEGLQMGELDHPLDHLVHRGAGRIDLPRDGGVCILACSQQALYLCLRV